MRHRFRLLLIVLAVLVVPATAHDLTAAPPDVGIPVPPAAVAYRVADTGPLLQWWQASNADAIVLLDVCGSADTLIGYEPGHPGWHERHTSAMGVGSCVIISEFFQGQSVGYYGPFGLEPRRLSLPLIGR